MGLPGQPVPRELEQAVIETANPKIKRAAISFFMMPRNRLIAKIGFSSFNLLQFINVCTFILFQLGEV
jgi:hypothetical protein